MQAINITIPAGLDFAALRLSRSQAGISFDWTPIEAICAASGIDPAVFRERDEDNVASLIVAWYAEHRRRGGAVDAVAEDLIAEAQAEDERGDGVSHQAGRA